MIEIEQFVFSYFGVNTYLVTDTASKEAMIIDPGCFAPDEKKYLEDYIVSNGVKLKYMLNTHCHIDHVLGNKFVKERFNPEFYIPAKDEFLLDILSEQSAMFRIPVEPSPRPDKYLSEGLELSIGDSKCGFLFTPGHTPGEHCVLFAEESRCFTGDVLFRESIGRTDLWDGNTADLMNSIKTKLITLNEDTVIYPGHGETSTIGYEKAQNPFLYNIL